MSNVKLAFERYMDFVSTQRRDSMLKWCLNLPTILTKTTENTTATTATSSIGSIEKSFLLPFRNKFSVSKLMVLKKNLQLFKRDFTSTRTRFFENNFDVLISRDCDPNDLLDKGEKQLEILINDLKIFSRDQVSYTPDIIAKVRNIFDWLYYNRLYKLAYHLLLEVFKDADLFFKMQHIEKLIIIMDKYGSPDDILKLHEIFQSRKIPKFLDKLSRLGNAELFITLKELSRCEDFINTIRLLNFLETKFKSNHSDGLNIIISNICARLIAKTTSNKEFKSQLVNLMMSSTNQRQKHFYTPSLISQLYSNLKTEDFCHNISFINGFMDLHINDLDYKYRILSALPNDNIINFYIWFTKCYQNSELFYNKKNSIPDSLRYLHHKKLYDLPDNFKSLMRLNEKEQYSNILSVLIYSVTKWNKEKSSVFIYYNLKKTLALPITRSDKIGYLKALVNKKQWKEALTHLNNCIAEDSNFASIETYDTIFIILSKNEDWSRLEALFTDLFNNEQITTKNQYATMFLALASRGATKYMLELWENYLKRGFIPDDKILSSIIYGYIKTKSFSEALQWFSAYSHYNIRLTPRSYGLMLTAVASSKDINAVLRLLDELAQLGLNLTKQQFSPALAQLAQLGDYKSIELILTKYYPLFKLPVEGNDSRFLMKAHYFANRFNIIVETYDKLEDNEISYQDTLLALESAMKYKDIRTFEKFWNRCKRLHFEEIDMKAYIMYMSYWVRIRGSFGIRLKLEEIKKKLNTNELPAMLFNQMIFSNLRMSRPWMTAKLVKIALLNGVVPTSKMYAMILQSYVTNSLYARENIDKTILMLEEILMHRKTDKFGKLEEDLNPMSLKLVMKAILRFKGVYEARRLFEMYVETSKDNLLDNLHVLNIELLILGEENRWVEFDGCYERYTDILIKRIEDSKMKGVTEDYDQITENRLVRFHDKYLGTSYDDYKIQNIKDSGVKIPTWLKKAHYDIWKYRLKQLSLTEKLDTINDTVEGLIKRGIVFSNANLNETALFLSGKVDLLEESVSFVDKFILPYHIQNKKLKMMKLRHRTNKLPGISDPIYRFNNNVYFKVMRNLNRGLNRRLTKEQKEDLLGSIRSSPNNYILKNLGAIMSNMRKMYLNYYSDRRLRKSFYKNKRNLKKNMTRSHMIRMSYWRVDKDGSYKKHEHKIRQELIKTVKDIKDTENRELVSKLIERKKELRTKINSLQNEKNMKLEGLLGRINVFKDKSFKVGAIDLYQDI